MPVVTFLEIINLIILSAAIGYIFTGYVKAPENISRIKTRFNWRDFKFALLVAAPGVVLHELAHKFIAIAFGLSAFFQVWYPGLGIAIFLKLINSPFLIVAPGYVNISNSGILDPFMNNLINVMVAFAGPAVNLIIWLIATLILTNARRLTQMQATTLYLTKKINFLLFVFNMLPIPPLDGFHVLFGLFKLIFSSF